MGHHRLLGVWCVRAGFYLPYASYVWIVGAGHSDGHSEDGEYDAECGDVWA